MIPPIEKNVSMPVWLGKKSSCFTLWKPSYPLGYLDTSLSISIIALKMHISRQPGRNVNKQGVSA